MNRTSRRTRLATAALLAPLALGLVACGGDDDADDAPVTTTSGSTAPDSSSEDGTSTDAGTSADTGTAVIEGDVETAAETALAEVDGTVFSVDHDGAGWDVTIVDADGVEQDLELSADGTSVARGPVADNDSDADDAAERDLLLGASLDHLAAIEAASADVQGTVTGVDLSEDNGTAVWEVTFNEDTPDETTVDVDANTGEVLRIELDD
ncbi:PepSY domain-containing protein [Nocardioides hwasunensis]|uniref:PepSY domain-containing protein n=1 Tax=Nocardioides hwasunensis TaxID=397258 RepID=A0ABR8MGX3_9ACTN|nr:PepSY domain-containing protein [Nocardioides hwasunensis]MBD3915326.1 PepSY domain-containing protein [Nocardioides hwasunensis]